MKIEAAQTPPPSFPLLRRVSALAAAAATAFVACERQHAPGSVPGKATPEEQQRQQGAPASQGEGETQA